MIRINLLKSPRAQKKRRAKKRPPFLFVIGATVGVALVAFAAYMVYHHYSPKLPQPAIVADSDFTPSSHTRKNMVEDVVGDLDDSRLALSETGYLRLPYHQLSFPEKVNFERTFAQRVIQILGACVPASIGLEKLDIDTFSVFSASGIGKTKEEIVSMFDCFRGRNLRILPKPLTRIWSAGEGSYRFTISIAAEIGLNLKDPAFDRSLSRIPPRTGLDGEIRKFDRLAARALDRSRKLTVLTSDKHDRFRRFVYRLEGSSSYKEFVQFVLDAHAQNIFFGFRNVRLKARTPEQVDITADILFTTKQ